MVYGKELPYSIKTTDGSIIKTGEVVIRSLIAHKDDGEIHRGRPLLTRPRTKDASGLMSAIRIEDWGIGLTDMLKRTPSVIGCIYNRRAHPF